MAHAKRSRSHVDKNATVSCVSAPTALRSDRHAGRRRHAFFRRKYLIDRWIGGLMLVVTSPLLSILFVLVKLTSPGPGFYRQKRVGLRGETFEIVKLRSMVNNAERPGKPVWCSKNDARVTPLGRVLRKLHLDELPQLWNVARGDMCLVGPRPERPEICDSLAEKIDDYYDRVLVKPGVTGLSQINLPPDETIDDARRKQILDLRYIEEANVWLELRILAATAMRMFGIKGETVMKSMRLCRRNLLFADEQAEKEATRFKVQTPSSVENPSFTFSPESDSGVLL